VGTIGVDGNPYAGVPTLRVQRRGHARRRRMVSMSIPRATRPAARRRSPGAASSSSLDNIDNLISGYGSLGAGTLTLTNEVKGTIKAIGGVLTVDTGANTATNKGLMEAIGGTLQLATNVRQQRHHPGRSSRRCRGRGGGRQHRTGGGSRWRHADGSGHHRRHRQQRQSVGGAAHWCWMAACSRAAR